MLRCTGYFARCSRFAPPACECKIAITAANLLNGNKYARSHSGFFFYLLPYPCNNVIIMFLSHT